MRNKLISPADQGTFHSAVEMKVFVRPAHTFRTLSDLHVVSTMGEDIALFTTAVRAQPVNFELSLRLSLFRSASDYLLCLH